MSVVRLCILLGAAMIVVVAGGRVKEQQARLRIRRKAASRATSRWNRGYRRRTREMMLPSVRRQFYQGSERVRQTLNRTEPAVNLLGLRKGVTMEEWRCRVRRPLCATVRLAGRRLEPVVGVVRSCARAQAALHSQHCTGHPGVLRAGTEFVVKQCSTATMCHPPNLTRQPGSQRTVSQGSVIPPGRSPNAVVRRVVM